jgi:hypothetical protein
MFAFQANERANCLFNFALPTVKRLSVFNKRQDAACTIFLEAAGCRLYFGGK